jgi:hypothetical protein
MRKVWLGIVGAVVCLGLGLAVVGCDSSKGAGKDKMQGDKMATDKMGGDNMQGDKMSSDKMGAGKMGSDKMSGDKMGTEMMGGGKMSGEAKDKK